MNTNHNLLALTLSLICHVYFYLLPSVVSTDVNPSNMMGKQQQGDVEPEVNKGQWLPSRNEGGEFRLKIAAREEFCFHEFFDLRELTNLKYNLNVRVLKGGRSKDIDINALTSKGTHIIKERRKKEFSGSLEISEGEWKFCLSNKFSSVSAKIVFFSLHPAETESLQKQAKKKVPTVLTYSDAALEAINYNMHRVQETQNGARLRMADHWYHAQGLHDRISNWSIVEIIFMCGSPIVQVTLLRRLFLFKKPKRTDANPHA